MLMLTVGLLVGVLVGAVVLSLCAAARCAECGPGRDELPPKGDL